MANKAPTTPGPAPAAADATGFGLGGLEPDKKTDLVFLKGDYKAACGDPEA